MLENNAHETPRSSATATAASVVGCPCSVGLLVEVFDAPRWAQILVLTAMVPACLVWIPLEWRRRRCDAPARTAATLEPCTVLLAYAERTLP